MRSVSYRLYPTTRQRHDLEDLLEIQRQLYNAALEERRGAWRWERRAVTRYDQYNGLTGAEEWCPELARFGRRVARGTLDRLDEAFGHFLRRAQAGERPGFPRFKSRARWDSVQWSNAECSWKILPTGKGTYGRLYIQGVGHISIKLHRRFDAARPAKLVVQRRLRGWEATVVYRNVHVERLPMTGRAAGVDLGVAVLAAVADDSGTVELVANPAPLTRARQRLESAQQALAACQKGSNRRQRARRRITRLHEQVRQQRRQYAHQLTARLVADYDLIAVEDLRITNMTRSARGTVEAPGTNVAAKAGLNRSVLDAGWGQLVNLLTYKAEGAGRKLVRVAAHHTSQTCARCGATDPANRPRRDHFTCTACGNAAHPDANAAQVILAIATGRITITRPPPPSGLGRATATQHELRLVK
ncbi:MAG: RNA-guided endonuclease InsQ/TnpB family protein [Acidimicrobiia bacterium]